MSKIIQFPKEQNHLILCIIKKNDGEQLIQVNDQDSGETNNSLQAKHRMVCGSWVTNLDKGGMLAGPIIPLHEPSILLPAPCLWD